MHASNRQKIEGTYRVQYQEEAVSSEINISFHFFVFDVAFLAVWDSNHACVRSDTFAPSTI